MKPVFQTILSPPNGNCMAACIASILELSIEDLPNPHGKDIWWEEWQEWLAPQNMYLINVEFEQGEDGWRPPGFWIADVDSPREFKESEGSPVAHAVVAKANKIVHDPHPKATNYSAPNLDTCVTIVIICLGNRVSD
jgi:hypothetical protein